MSITKFISTVTAACAVAMTVQTTAMAHDSGHPTATSHAVIVTPTACTVSGFGTNATATRITHNGKNAILLNVFGEEANAAAEMKGVFLPQSHPLVTFQFDTSADFNSGCFDNDPGDVFDMILFGLVTTHHGHSNTSDFVHIDVAEDAFKLLLTNGDTRCLFRSSALVDFREGDLTGLWVACDGPQSCNYDAPNTFSVLNFIINGTKINQYANNSDNSACKFLELE